MEQLQNEDLPLQPTQNPINRFREYSNRITSRKEPLLLVVIFFIVLLGVGIFSSNRVNKDGNKTSDTQGNNEYISDDIIIYGYWNNDKTHIALRDLSSNSEGILAVLSTNVKHVKITSPTTIMYIAQTDERDHGRVIMERNLETGNDIPIYSAEPDFGIDDYVVSKDGKYLSVWEIKIPEGSNILTNGESRVFNYDTGFDKKYPIYDESFSPGEEVSYPIGITDFGELFTDKFVANSGAGWAYGMSKSNLDGSKKENLASMQNGTYSSQPIMSPDGKYIAFTGYSGENGTVDEDGIRVAIKKPNTVEILDTQTLERTVIRTSQDNLYPTISWDTESANLLFVESFVNGQEYNFTQFAYDPATKITQEVIFSGNSDENNYGIAYAKLNNGSYLLGKKEISGNFMGNLGGKYGRALKSLSLWNAQDNKHKEIGFLHFPLQLISIVNKSYFSENLVKNSVQDAKNQLQLMAVVIKQDLEPKRKLLQSYPPPPIEVPQLPNVPVYDAPQECVDGMPYQTAKQCFGDTCGDFLLARCNGEKACEDFERENNISNDGTCTDSPLYLYGEEGQKIKVKIGVALYSPNISYSPQQGVEAVISSNGSFYANNKLIQGLKFDYTPGIKKIIRPDYGVITTRKELAPTILEFSKELGLNNKEAADLLQEASDIASNYIYFSFFDHKTSNKILPLYFDPTPDTYRNIVFYAEGFDERPTFKYKKPIFEKIKRVGLTAIEISVMKR